MVIIDESCSDIMFDDRLGLMMVFYPCVLNFLGRLRRSFGMAWESLSVGIQLVTLWLTAVTEVNAIENLGRKTCIGEVSRTAW